MDVRKKVLIVDDTAMNRMLLSEMLSDEYDVIEASDGAEALVHLRKSSMDIALVLLDLVMPNMNGFEVMKAMEKGGLLDEIPVIIISSETAPDIIEQAFDMGAVEFIARPFNESTVKRRVHNTIMLYSKQRLLVNLVTEQVLDKEKNSHIMIEILGHVVEFRNRESGNHVKHIGVLTEKLLNRLMQITDKYEFTSEDISLITTASALHDIGKIVISEEILNKPGRLTSEEYEIMKQHCVAGYNMLEQLEDYKNEKLIRFAISICRWHHERYDGKGYPDGLVGDEIPISAQVVAMADVYDALTNERVYKPAYPHEEAIQMIINGECGAFNPLLLQCLKDLSADLQANVLEENVSIISRKEIIDKANVMIHGSQLSNRVMDMFEFDIKKNEFLYSISREIFFEYDAIADILTNNENGVRELNLPATIAHPADSPTLNALVTQETLKRIIKRLRECTVDNSDFQEVCDITIDGEKRSYDLFARTIWMGESLYNVVGRLTEVQNDGNKIQTCKNKE